MRGANRLVAGALGRAAAFFYHVERSGPVLPGGPVLVVANHPNVFLDPLVLFRTAGRPTRPLTKASHFENPVYRPFLAALGGLPVYRRQDDPSLMHRNEETFRAAVAALAAGDAIQIYPEGRSHSEPALAPLRTGAARIALMAEEEAGWELGLAIVPVGLTYERKTRFRGRAMAAYGAPFDVAGLAADYAADPSATVRRLTDEIADRLEAVTLNLARDEDRDLIEIAERLYGRERSAEVPAASGLADRLPRLRAFAGGLAWLRAHDPDRHRRLARAVRRHWRALEMLGVGDGALPERYPPLSVARYAAREGAALVVGLPLALAGFALWCLPYLVPRAVTRLARPESQSVATYKLVAGLGVGIVTWVGWTLLAGRLWGGWGALATALALPVLGAVALAWAERWQRVRRDAALFARAAGRGGLRRRLAARRAELAEEFDGVWREMREAGAASAED